MEATMYRPIRWLSQRLRQDFDYAFALVLGKIDLGLASQEDDFGGPVPLKDPRAERRDAAQNSAAC